MCVSTSAQFAGDERWAHTSRRMRCSLCRALYFGLFCLKGKQRAPNLSLFWMCEISFFLHLCSNLFSVTDEMESGLCAAVIYFLSLKFPSRMLLKQEIASARPFQQCTCFSHSPPGASNVMVQRSYGTRFWELCAANVASIAYIYFSPQAKLYVNCTAASHLKIITNRQNPEQALLGISLDSAMISFCDKVWPWSATQSVCLLQAANPFKRWRWVQQLISKMR